MSKKKPEEQDAVNEIVDSVTEMETDAAELFQDGEAVTTPDKKSYRQKGSGSVYPVGDKFSFCIQLTSDKVLKQMYGNKLRYLKGGFKTENEAKIACTEALERKDEFLQQKLEKLGHNEPQQ